jgi:hypothetical protein
VEVPLIKVSVVVTVLSACRAVIALDSVPASRHRAIGVLRYILTFENGVINKGGKEDAHTLRGVRIQAFKSR